MMRAIPFPRSGRWASLLFVAAGLSMITLWSIYTTVHGPTSYDRTGVVLGRSTLFWGSLLGGVPNLLLVLALLLIRGTLFNGTRIVSKAGFVLALLGLFIPAGVDLIAGGLGPPLFVPVVGVGLVLLALGNWHVSEVGSLSAYLLLFIGVIQLIVLAIPTDLFGYGYRLSGLMAYFLVGLGWIAFGISHLSRKNVQRPV